MGEDGPEKRTLWAHARKYAFRYLGAAGIAIGCAAEMDGVLHFSSWINYLTRFYRFNLIQLYQYLGDLIGFHPPLWVWDAVVMTFFYVGVMAYGIARGKPVDVALETRKQKESFVWRRVPVSIWTAATCVIFAGMPLQDVLVFVALFFPFSVLLYTLIAVRMKVMRYQFEREHIRFLVLVWVLIGVLIVFSQIQVFEFLAGKPPPPPEINTPGPFGVGG